MEQFVHLLGRYIFLSFLSCMTCSRTHLHLLMPPRRAHIIQFFPVHFALLLSLLLFFQGKYIHTRRRDALLFHPPHLHSSWRRFIVFCRRWSSIIHFGGRSEQMELLHRQLINDFQFFIHFSCSLSLGFSENLRKFFFGSKKKTLKMLQSHRTELIGTSRKVANSFLSTLFNAHKWILIESMKTFC